MRRRQAFTLVEVLVATSLVLFVMAIMSEAFVAGLESFRQLKAVGDLNRRLRGATTLIRSDLRADHFGQNKPLSQTGFAPAQGFFRIYQGTPPTVEGVDADGIPSTRAIDHMVHLTINRTNGGDPSSLFSTALPNSPLVNHGPAAYQDGTNFHTQWAEVAYFLKPQGNATAAEPGTSSLPLYSLYRRQRLLVTDPSLLAGLNQGPNRVPASQLSQYCDVSCFPDPLNPSWLYFNGPSGITAPVTRLGMTHNFLLGNLLGLVNAGQLAQATYPTLQDDGSPPSLWGGDLALTDVISFEVKVSTGGDFVELFDPGLVPFLQNPAFLGPGKPRVFDTWSNLNGVWFDYLPLWDLPGTTSSVPMKVQVQAVQITIRVWDFKAQKTRQVTIIQEM